MPGCLMGAGGPSSGPLPCVAVLSRWAIFSVFIFRSPLLMLFSSCKKLPPFHFHMNVWHTPPHTCVFIRLMELKFLEVFMTPSPFPTLFQQGSLCCQNRQDFKTHLHLFLAPAILFQGPILHYGSPWDGFPAEGSVSSLSHPSLVHGWGATSVILRWLLCNLWPVWLDEGSWWQKGLRSKLERWKIVELPSGCRWLDPEHDPHAKHGCILRTI